VLRDGKGNWIARDAGGRGGVPKRRGAGLGVGVRKRMARAGGDGKG